MRGIEQWGVESMVFHTRRSEVVRQRDPRVGDGGRRLAGPVGTRRALGSHELPCPRVTDVWDLVGFNPPGQYCS
jgi:hypothetical protein